MANDMISVEFKGLDAATRDLSKIIKRFGSAAIARVLRTELEIEKTKIVRVTPFEFGNLRGSITVDTPTVSGNDISCRVYAGGPAAPYALAVHENLTARHQAPTGAKFIERPLHEATPQLGQRIAARLLREAGE